MAGVTLGSVTSYIGAIVGAEQRFRPQQRIGSNEWWGLWWGVWGGGEETPHIVVMVQSPLLLYSVDEKKVRALLDPHLKAGKVLLFRERLLSEIIHPRPRNHRC